MPNKAVLQQRVKDNTQILFDTMSGNERTVNQAWGIIDTTLDKLSLEMKSYSEKSSQTDLGFLDKRKLKSAHETSAKTILADAVDKLANLPVSDDGRKQENITALKDSLKALVGKDGGVASAKNAFASNTVSHMPQKQEEATRVNTLIQSLQQKSSSIAKLVAKDKEIPITSPYYQEYMFELHLPIAQGAGTELIHALHTTFSTGEPPAHFKKFDSATPNENLYDTMKRTLEEHKGDKRAFFEAMQTEFTNSPHIPNEMVHKNFQSVSYLDATEREAYKLTIRDGKLYQNDVPFDTSQVLSKNIQGEVAFVITADGEFLAAPHKGGEFHHSSFMSGERVVAAGMMKVVDGKIITMDNNSGHYKPQEHNMVQGLNTVPNIGTVFYDDGNITVKYSPSQQAPESFHDFMKRAEPLAEQKWKEIEEGRDAYKEKITQKVKEAQERQAAQEQNKPEAPDLMPVADEAQLSQPETIPLKKGIPYELAPNVANDDLQPSEPKKEDVTLAIEEVNPTGFRQEATPTGRDAVKKMFEMAQQQNHIDMNEFNRLAHVALDNEVERFDTITLNDRTLQQYLGESAASNKQEALESLKLTQTKVASKDISKDLQSSGISFGAVASDNEMNYNKGTKSQSQPQSKQQVR